MVIPETLSGRGMSLGNVSVTREHRLYLGSGDGSESILTLAVKEMLHGV